MTSAGGPAISVRGTASRLVDPDEATVQANIDLRQSTREQANAAVSQARDWVAEQLAALGGSLRTAANHRDPLTWTVSAPSVHEYEDQRRTVYAASSRVTVSVRDLALVGRVLAALRSGPVQVWGVHWTVDDDNPAWREVRAEAIHAAVAKARDYAAALGATLAGIEQIADAGLLASGGEEARPIALAARSAAMGGGADEVSVDPEPQEISAVIEARVIATPVSL